MLLCPQTSNRKDTEMFIRPKRARDRVFAHLLNTFCSWDGCRGAYIDQFQKNLEQLSIELSQATGRWLKVRYNNLLGCAEIFSPCDRVIAWIAVHGSMCLPDTVYVTTPVLPDSEVRKLIGKYLIFPFEGTSPKLGVEIRFRTFV
jgi:hypothetical protein